MGMPFGIYAVLVLLVLFIIFYRIEKIKHENNLKAIPARIWVNGTRGKSSVTRLIAAGLRADGKRVIAKTTGTSPKFIISKDDEQPVIRLGRANIKEQIRIIKKSVKYSPEAIVLECMALRPDLQSIESTQIVKPNVIVITNIRSDHLDVMGPTTKDVAKTFINAITKDCVLFISEPNMFNELFERLRKKGVEIQKSRTNNISDKIINQFSYIEHKENVALALNVCKYFGIDEKTALISMQHTNPDPGALRKYNIDLNGKETTLFYAMAANDPESIHQIWQSVDEDYREINLLINCRDDRIDRSFQIAKLIRQHLRTDQYILTGSGTDLMARELSKFIEKTKILNLGGKSPKHVVVETAKFVSTRSLIFAIGNTVGYGIELMNEFQKYEMI